jgi:hypothetical protein
MEISIMEQEGRVQPFRSSTLSNRRNGSTNMETETIRRRTGYRIHTWQIAPFAPTSTEQLLQLAENSNPGKIVVDKDRVVDITTVGKEIWGKKRCLKCPSDIYIVKPETLFRRPLWKVILNKKN